ncbi:hypothetical protein FYC62_09650 [Pedobacter aquae]|uniref:Uncharacterized protein n=1 Tax=Pedobacter aquae TaxID=2605747 RepID=A0A5C0VL26_9SPHI|nr:hypothetical protein [Pedobacter aquae]QEK51880.1 hypothetical protein FYC62_09650 [Pedobacter aquae]
MKIVSIFEDSLFAICYGDGSLNEFDKLMDLWTNVAYLKEFAVNNKVVDVAQFVEDRLAEADKLQDKLDEIMSNHDPLEKYFMPLYNSETGFKILSLQKGKLSKSKLRIYAIKIDENMFLITGGAIKMSQEMKDHDDTKNELDKLNTAQQYLKSQGIFDYDSFFELLNEENDH